MNDRQYNLHTFPDKYKISDLQTYASFIARSRDIYENVLVLYYKVCHKEDWFSFENLVRTIDQKMQNHSKRKPNDLRRSINRYHQTFDWYNSLLQFNTEVLRDFNYESNLTGVFKTDSFIQK